MALSELQDGGYKIGLLPTQDDATFQDHVFKSCIALVLEWCDDSQACDLFPRLQNVKTSVRTSAYMWKTMFNCLNAPKVTHLCSGPGCCSNLQACTKRVTIAIDDVVVALLLAGTPDPTECKWFSAAVRIRAMLVALASN